MPELSLSERVEEMEKIAAELAGLEQSPLYRYRVENDYQAVIGEGSLAARILFIGEAPGAQEAKSGRPFVGASGRLLDEMLRSAGLQREQVYITNVVKDRPPENRDPSVEEIALYSTFLERQIEIIRPQVIATLGRFSMDFIFRLLEMPQQGEKISRLHGKLLEAHAPYGKVFVLPLFHPAVALYNQDQRETLFEDFKALKQFAGREG